MNSASKGSAVLHQLISFAIQMFPPYIIKHIHLEKKSMVFDNTFEGEERYYIVLWWKEIPLGQFFIEPGHHPVDDFKSKVMAAIEPVVDLYIARQQLTVADYKDKFFSDHEEFITEMDKIFSYYTKVSLPDRVDVSVVICTRNRSSYLRRCLNSLMDQKCLPCEVIVVDNAPSDESTREVVDQFSGVTYSLEPRPGLDIARNLGAKMANCSIVAYTDDDVLVHPLWIYRLWETFLAPGVAAMTGLIIAHALDTEAQQIFEKYWSFNRGYEDKLYSPSFVKTHQEVVRIGAGANMAFRKSVFAKVGYFDERLDVGAAGCNGDSEIWFRILADGFDIYYNPRAVVYHEHRKELQALQKQLYNYMRGFAAAALIQQTQDKTAGFKRHVYYGLPRYYLTQLVRGFPYYAFNYRTLLSEIRGLLSGIWFFHKHRKAPSQPHFKS